MPRKLFNDKGERIFKQYVVKIYSPGNAKFQRLRFAAPAGRGYSEQAIHDNLTRLADEVEQHWPDAEYRLVETGPTSFNFVWTGQREKSGHATTVEQSA